MKRIEEQLETIYALLAKGLSNSAIAKRVGVSERTIGKINNGESYWESGREYPVRKKEEERKEPKERNGEIAEQEQELWRIAYELVVAQWYHEQKTLSAIFAMRRIPFEPSVFPFDQQELEGEMRPRADTMVERLEYLNRRLRTCLHLLSNTLNL